jgi:hypothetical protein
LMADLAGCECEAGVLGRGRLWGVIEKGHVGRVKATRSELGMAEGLRRYFRLTGGAMAVANWRRKESAACCGVNLVGGILLGAGR